MLIVSQDSILTENLQREMPADRSFRVAVATSGFEAGIQVETCHPDCVIVDFSLGQADALQVCQNLRRNIKFTETLLIALLPGDGTLTSFDRIVVNEVFRKPLDVALLAEHVRTRISAKKEFV